MDAAKLCRSEGAGLDQHNPHATKLAAGPQVGVGMTSVVEVGVDTVSETFSEIAANLALDFNLGKQPAGPRSALATARGVDPAEFSLGKGVFLLPSRTVFVDRRRVGADRRGDQGRIFAAKGATHRSRQPRPS